MKQNSITKWAIVFCFFLTLFIPLSALAETPLSLQSKSVSPGGTIVLLLNLSSDGGSIAAVSTDISYDPNVLSNPSAKSGLAGKEADKNVWSYPVDNNTFRIGVLSLENNHAISDGTVAKVSFDVAGNAPIGTSLQLTQKMFIDRTLKQYHICSIMHHSDAYCADNQQTDDRRL